MMTIGFIVWDQTWKGSAVALNIFKCSLASGLFIITIAIVGHSSMSTYLSPACGMLILSSLLGIVVGDVAWLQALQMLGARRVILVDSLKPFLASILGYFILDEAISAVGCVGMVVTIVGVSIVSLESVHEPAEEKAATTTAEANASYETVQTGEADISPLHYELSATASQADLPVETDMKAANPPSAASPPLPATLRKGYVFAILNVIFDAYGAVLTKEFGAVFTLSEINLVRFGFAAMSLGALAGGFKLHSLMAINQQCSNDLKMKTISGVEMANIPCEYEMGGMENVEKVEIIDHPIQNTYGESLTSEENHSDLNWFEFPRMPRLDWVKIAVGVVFVTYTCPSLFNYALFRLKLGLCLTITSLGPIFAIPLVYIMKNERTSLRAIGGSALSFVGVAMLMLTENSD